MSERVSDDEPYGRCPICGAPGVLRERCLNGDDQCRNGHTYPSRDAVLPQNRVAQLEAAIRTHRSQKADDRCIEDDDRLYEVLGDGIKCDRRVGDKAAMLRNCERFINNRCEGGEWPTYAELEAENARLRSLEPYVQHLPGCDIFYSHKNSKEVCTCGLDKLKGA